MNIMEQSKLIKEGKLTSVRLCEEALRKIAENDQD